MAAPPRTQDDVRREIERERERLVIAVEQLRGDIRSVANVKPMLKKVAIGVAALVAVKLAVSAVRRRRR
jgi:hypothetical protein